MTFVRQIVASEAGPSSAGNRRARRAQGNLCSMILSRPAGVVLAAVVFAAVVVFLVIAFTSDGFFSGGGRTVSCVQHVEGKVCTEG